MQQEPLHLSCSLLVLHTPIGNDRAGRRLLQRREQFQFPLLCFGNYSADYYKRAVMKQAAQSLKAFHFEVLV